ncbi:hypothetical protein MRS84_22615, partial [Escherichia coli]|nr:hypothetical protein [Escherichia coli]
PINWRFDTIYPLLVANLMLILAWGATEAVDFLFRGREPVRILGAIETVAGVGVGLIVYLGLLILIPLIEDKELDWLPGGNKLRAFIQFIRRKQASSLKSNTNND